MAATGELQAQRRRRSRASRVEHRNLVVGNEFALEPQLDCRSRTATPFEQNRRRDDGSISALSEPPQLERRGARVSKCGNQRRCIEMDRHSAGGRRCGARRDS